MKIGIVGSRHRADRASVEQVVSELPPDAIVVSGGCRGVDTWAVDAARRRGLGVEVIRPNLTGTQHRGEVVQAYFDRNAVVAERSDRLIAFVAPDRKGGTENTIAAARSLGRPVEIR